METFARHRDLCRYLAECARRSLAEGSATVRATTELNVPGAGDLPTEVIGGYVDFSAERCQLGVGAQYVVVIDGQLLYERKEDGRWIRHRLPAERYHAFDPRGMLELLTIGCRSAHAIGDREYAVQYDRGRAAQWAHPNLAPSWASITGTVEVDTEHRVMRVSSRMSTESGKDYAETVLALGDFGLSVRIEPPADDLVIEHADDLRERYSATGVRGDRRPG